MKRWLVVTEAFSIWGQVIAGPTPPPHKLFSYYRWRWMAALDVRSDRASLMFPPTFFKSRIVGRVTRKPLNNNLIKEG